MAALKRMPKLAIVAALCLLVVSRCPVIHGQATNPAPALVITILDGEGALNDIRQRTAREPIVQVQDENHRPIAGAAVLFTLPGSGPGGSFAGGAPTFSTVTDSAGRAVAHGLRPNNVSGSYEIHVRVTYNGSTTETSIHQQNISGQSSSVTQHAAHAISAKTIVIIVAAAAAAGAVAAVVVTNGGGSSTVITPGTPTVGAPPTAGIRIGFHVRSH